MHGWRNQARTGPAPGTRPADARQPDTNSHFCSRRNAIVRHPGLAPDWAVRVHVEITVRYRHGGWRQLRSSRLTAWPVPSTKPWPCRFGLLRQGRRVSEPRRGPFPRHHPTRRTGRADHGAARLGQRIEGTTKSGRSRTVSIDPGTVQILRDHRKRQAGERLRVGPSGAALTTTYSPPPGASRSTQTRCPRS